MKLFCSILPDLQNCKGHIYQYHLSTQAAVEKNGWKYTAWIPINCGIGPLPSNWLHILPSTARKRTGQFLDYFYAFKKAIKKFDPSRETIFFLEHFRLVHLLSLFLALLGRRPRFQIWILHRYAREQMTLRGKLHKILYKIFWKNSLRFFSDSELLSREQSEFFGCEVTTLPIPHAQVSSVDKFPKESHFIYCWWPGSATRESKGLKEICSLSLLLKSNPSIPVKLIVARNAVAKGVHVSPALILTEDEMSRETYEKWLNTADIALLPYSPLDYRLSTSGIFVEAIANGIIPIVAKNTWMAFELQKYNLSELAIDWTRPLLGQTIACFAHSKDIKEKIGPMQRVYADYHSIEQFSLQLFQRILV